MNKAKRGAIQDARMLTCEQGMNFTGMGRNSFRKFCDEINATRRFGRMVRYDKELIVREFDRMSQG